MHQIRNGTVLKQMENQNWIVHTVKTTVRLTVSRDSSTLILLLTMIKRALHNRTMFEQMCRLSHNCFQVLMGLQMQRKAKQMHNIRTHTHTHTMRINILYKNCNAMRTSQNKTTKRLFQIGIYFVFDCLTLVEICNCVASPQLANQPHLINESNELEN